MSKLLIIVLSIILAACISEGKDDTKLAQSDSDQHRSACNPSDGVNWQALLTEQCQKLSDYNLFINPADPRSGPQLGGNGYQLNSQLFTDHARKYRYVFLPQGEQAVFVGSEALDFPVGSVFVKVFALPQDTSKPQENIIEVRLMIHRASGWVGLPYVWDLQAEDAYLDLSGDSVSFTMQHEGNEYKNDYIVPSYGECRKCHQYNGRMALIGPKARLLNKDIVIAGESINQLVYWQQAGLLSDQGFPSILSDIEYAPDWRDDTKALSNRVKAYLDINCAHCHRSEGTASLSGLKLEYGRVTIDYNHGVCNSAHGWRGGGFDIWPGSSEQSSLVKRMTLSGAPDRMPPLGRSLIDEKAVELIRQWIDAMPYKECASTNY